jgi:hypothetical protein
VLVRCPHLALCRLQARDRRVEVLVLLLMRVQRCLNGVYAHLKRCERFQLNFDGIQPLQHGRQCRFENHPRTGTRVRTHGRGERM